jgi:hypothetical protein
LGVNHHSIRQGVEQGLDLHRGAFAKLFETAFGAERTNHDLSSDMFLFAFPRPWLGKNQNQYKKKRFTSLFCQLTSL